jgi:hypothetical protein
VQQARQWLAAEPVAPEVAALAQQAPDVALVMMVPVFPATYRKEQTARKRAWKWMSEKR